MKAAMHDMEDPTKKFLAAVTFDECRHDEVCRRACKLCPNFPYFRPVERHCSDVLRFFVNDCLISLARIRSLDLGSGTVLVLVETWLNNCGEYRPKQ